MKKLVIPQLVTLVGFVATYLIAAPQAMAQESMPNFPLLQIEGLRFDTPLPLTHSNSLKPGGLNFLSSLQFGSFEPVIITAQNVSSDLSDILIPPVLAEEETETTVLGTGVDESSESAQTSEENTVVVSEATAAGQVILSQKKTTVVNKKVSSKKVSTTTTGEITPLAVATSPTPIPTAKPTVAPTEKPAETVTKPLALSNGGLNADVLFDMSNNYRREHGLEPFVKDDRACALAVSRAPEIGAEISGGHMHSGLRARNLPYWNSENIISMRSEQAAFNWWINDKIHHDQIMGDYKYSCVACSGNNCAQEFTNFVSKK